jgi:hypothetical protein
MVNMDLLCCVVCETTDVRPTETVGPYQLPQYGSCGLEFTLNPSLRLESYDSSCRGGARVLADPTSLFEVRESVIDAVDEPNPGGRALDQEEPCVRSERRAVGGYVNLHLPAGGLDGDNTRLRWLLGGENRDSLREGLARTCRWLDRELPKAGWIPLEVLGLPGLVWVS